MFVPAALEPKWKWTTLTFVSAGLWSLTRGSAYATATTALVIANGLMYRIVTSLIPQNASDVYWHVWIPTVAAALHYFNEGATAGPLMDYTLPMGFVSLYAALVMLGVLNQYSAIHCGSFALKVACMLFYFVLTLVSVRLLHK